MPALPLGGELDVVKIVAGVSSRVKYVYARLMLRAHDPFDSGQEEKSHTLRGILLTYTLKGIIVIYTL